MSGERHVLRFVRHGATHANSAGLRCGGDLDLPMTALGHEQAQRVAEHVARLDPPVGLIVTSDLRRTRETADAIARRLPAAEVVVEPAFAERRLGRWNLLPVGASQPWFESGQTPPDGESDDEFVARITRAVQALRPDLPRRPVLVASKGVARVLGKLTGHDIRLEPENGDVLEFDLSPQPGVAAAGSNP
ncbi:MAG TPA: histidine phosphatase family protein [Burkholderiaceae bacterium]|nr:histidine phosphatase family protein [Burkholderiaceae bacterium]